MFSRAAFTCPSDDEGNPFWVDVLKQKTEKGKHVAIFFLWKNKKAAYKVAPLRTWLKFLPGAERMRVTWSWQPWRDGGESFDRSGPPGWTLYGCLGPCPVVGNRWTTTNQQGRYIGQWPTERPAYLTCCRRRLDARSAWRRYPDRFSQNADSSVPQSSK